MTARTGHLYPRDVWPDLSVLAVWLGGAASVYVPMLRQFYGATALRDHGLSASEGRMTIPLRDGTPAGLLDFTHHYFEFVPEEAYDANARTTLEAHELEIGSRYYVLLTTSGGLYRYHIHDVVRCVGFEGQAPMLEFCGRGAHASSITGEKLTESQVIEAVAPVFESIGSPLEPFTLAPVMNRRLGYVLLVEPLARPTDVQMLASAVDRELSRLNIEYLDKRTSGRLDPVTVQEIPHGTRAIVREERLRSGGSQEEYKHPCLVSDLSFVRRVLSRGVEPHVTTRVNRPSR